MRGLVLTACVVVFAPICAFISGDAFEKIADHVYKPHAFIAEKVSCGDVIFVRGGLLDRFFSEAEQSISAPYILITHNSDLNITEAREGYLARPRLYHWFAQNCVGLSDERLTPIPIGLMNPIYYKGQTTYFRSILERSAALGKLYLVSYLGCKVRRIRERVLAESYFKQLSVCNYRKKQPFLDYLQMVTQSRFVVCPEGAGFDTHRIWESLYLGAYPIVKHSCMDSLFEHLPVMLVSSWDEVTEEALLQVSEEFNRRDWDRARLSMEYWKGVIFKEQYRCRNT